MKIFLAQQNYHIGNFENNTSKIIDAIQHAKIHQADLIVFSELCVCGYAPKDFLDFKDFIDKCYNAIDIIKQHADTIGVLLEHRTEIQHGMVKIFLTALFFCMKNK